MASPHKIGIHLTPDAYLDGIFAPPCSLFPTCSMHVKTASRLSWDLIWRLKEWSIIVIAINFWMLLLSCLPYCGWVGDKTPTTTYWAAVIGGREDPLEWHDQGIHGTGCFGGQDMPNVRTCCAKNWRTTRSSHTLNVPA